MRAVITTTIYPPTNLKEWAKCLSEGDYIVVSGDVKTPHKKVTRVLDEIHSVYGVGVLYVPRGDEWHCTKVIGENSIQRRNIAVLEAIRLGATQLTTVDTDNYPKDANYIDEVETLLTKPFSGRSVMSKSLWYNVGNDVDPRVIHRGLPLWVRRHASLGTPTNVTDAKIGVFSSLWIGDPDIDAIERAHNNPQVFALRRTQPFILQRNTWAPFNSQATTYARALLPLACVWPGVGRMDDIWASYVARRVIDAHGYSVAYGTPWVRQERHDHDIVSDLSNELLGYRYTGKLTAAIRGHYALDTWDGVLTNLMAVLETVRMLPFIPDQTNRFFDAWHEDVTRALLERPLT